MPRAFDPATVEVIRRLLDFGDYERPADAQWFRELGDLLGIEGTFKELIGVGLWATGLWLMRGRHADSGHEDAAKPFQGKPSSDYGA